MADQRTVWLAYYLDYEQSYVAAVATTREGAIEAVKANYGPPYIVEWSAEDDALCGEFEAVPGKSTKHRAVYSLDEHPLYEKES